MRIRVDAPDANEVSLTIPGERDRPLTADGGAWVGDVEEGTQYGLIVDGGSRTLVDPDATAVRFASGHDRNAARPEAGPNHAVAPRAVARPWPDARPNRPTARPLVVSELHVRGATKRRPGTVAGTFLGLIAELPRLAATGVSVIELLPVHQFDPDEGNYWGYMAIVFGAVHQQYAAGDDANRELADVVAAAHDHDIEIWLDVVFNHTTEEDEHGPVYNLRGLADDHYYVRDADGAYVDDAGCGNIIDTHSPIARGLIMRSLDRFADLGVDGFRFDLATVLARNPEFVLHIGDWAEQRGVRLVAEAWDVVRYHVGRAWPDPRWMQWNGRYRDDMRGFLRGEGGLIGAVTQRLQGSPDLFDRPARSVNFLTAHDGFTLYDLVAYDRKHNEANGWAGRDGTDENRSWNCGWEGDEEAPDRVMALRRRQLRNAWTMLMLSHGTPMFVAGDEFARTQGGNNNAYNQDNETSWIDWSRREEWVGLEEFARRMIAFRTDHPVLYRDEWWGSDVEWFGVSGCPDLGSHSRAIAWHLPGLYVMVNMWWEPLEFEIQASGPWRRAIDTTTEDGFVAEPETAWGSVALGPRSIVVLIS